MVLAQRIRAFVAGALSVVGLRGLTWLITGIASQESAGWILPCLFISISLPLGLWLITESSKAISITRLYLWIMTLVQGALLLILLCHLLPPEAPELSLLRTLTGFLGALALLLLFKFGSSILRSFLAS
jgi:hypothetical protein